MVIGPCVLSLCDKWVSGPLSRTRSSGVTQTGVGSAARAAIGETSATMKAAAASDLVARQTNPIRSKIVPLGSQLSAASDWRSVWLGRLSDEIGKQSSN